MQDKIDYTRIIGIKVFLEIVSKRILVGDLLYKTGNYVFTYDDKYLNYKKAIPLGPELPLTKQSFQDTKIFESFWDRIPSKHNLFYPEYCRQFNIDPNEDNILVLLATIGSMVPSSFIFEPLWEDSFTGVTLRVFRGILELSTRDFASAFGISQATIVRIENNNASGTEILKFLEILYKFPETAAIYYVRKYGKLHSRIKEKVILTLNVMHSLIKAAYFGKIKVVKALLSNPKFDINERCAENGKTALHWAAQYAGCNNDHFEILKLLLEHTGIDVNIKDKNDHTALYYAAENGSVNAVNLLAPKTNYEELKKAHDIAQIYIYAPPPDDRKKICKILVAEINSRPEHQKILNEDSKHKERLKQQQFKGYVPCIESSYELYKKYIFPLYNKNLTTKELKDTIEKLSTKEHANVLSTFRRNYKDNNTYKAESNYCLQEKHKKLDEKIKKYDYEVVPTYHIIKYLEAGSKKIESVTFSAKKQDNLKYDALLLFKNQNICLELTRSIDGKQENNMKQLLRQDGMAFSTVIDNRIKEPVIKDQLHYINNTGEVTYNKETKNFDQEFPLAQGDLHKTIFPSKLDFALQKKQQKDYCKERAMYWLVITIDMGVWFEHFNETCKIFYEKCLKNKKTGFERIFVFLENNNGSSQKCIWDSQDPDNVHQIKK